MNRNFRTGFTCSAFDLFHAGHIDMLQQAKQVCEYLIVGLQSDPTIDRQTKNKPIQSIVERQIQLKASSLVDEIYIYNTEKDLETLFNILPIDIRIIGEEYRDKPFTGKDICLERGIEIWYNRRRHSFSSSELRKRVAEAEKNNNYNISTIALSPIDDISCMGGAYDIIQGGGAQTTLSFWDDDFYMSSSLSNDTLCGEQASDNKK
jgi:glycerol-3-phosphate cytidylyltransferase